MNANVFYELGLAHGLGIPTVLLTQDIDEVPFDLRAYRIRQYGTQFNEVKDFTAWLERVGRDHRNGKISFGNPVTDFLPGDMRVDRSRGLVGDVADYHLKDLRASLPQVIECVQALIDEAETARDRIGSTLGFVRFHSARAQRLGKAYIGRADARVGRSVGARLVDEFMRHVADMEEIVGTLEQKNTELRTGPLSGMTFSNLSSVSKAGSVEASMTQLIETMPQLRNDADELTIAMGDLNSDWRPLRTAIRDAGDVLARASRAAENANSFAQRTLRVLDLARDLPDEHVDAA